MKSAGTMLKRVRERLNLRYRDVEESSHAIARRHNSDEFVIALSRLSDIENKGTPPSIYRLYSLCSIYRLDLLEVLKWYGVPVDQLAADGLLARQPSTHLIPYDGASNGNGAESYNGGPPSVERTSVLPRSHQANGWLAQSMLGANRKKTIRFGIIGEDDGSMAPIIPPSSVVMIDDSRRKIARSGWKNEMERPIYFLETREGFICRWCTLQDGELIAIPHPSSNLTPKRYHYPAEIEVVGEVMGIAMQRPRVRAPKARS